MLYIIKFIIPVNTDIINSLFIAQSMLFNILGMLRMFRMMLVYGLVVTFVEISISLAHFPVAK